MSQQSLEAARQFFRTGRFAAHNGIEMVEMRSVGIAKCYIISGHTQRVLEGTKPNDILDRFDQQQKACQKLQDINPIEP